MTTPVTTDHDVAQGDGDVGPAAIPVGTRRALPVDRMHLRGPGRRDVSLKTGHMRRPYTFRAGRLTFRYRRPQVFEPEPQEVVGRDQPLRRLASVAAGDSLIGRRVKVDGRWRRGLGRSGRIGWAKCW